MDKRIVIWDLICYLIFPLVIWNSSKADLGDYYAMLISSVPGIIYSIIRFILLKRINLFGIFMVSNLFVGTMVDVFSGTAIRMLWNDVYYSYFVGFLFIVTIIINRPLFLFFSLDIVEMQGQNRDRLKKLFYQKKVLLIFKLITFGFAFREILLSSVNGWLVVKYGVNSFDKAIILRQILNWGITGISMYGFIHISNLLKATDDITPNFSTQQESNDDFSNGC